MSESIGPAHDAGAAKGSTLAAVAVGGDLDAAALEQGPAGQPLGLKVASPEQPQRPARRQLEQGTIRSRHHRPTTQQGGIEARTDLRIRDGQKNVLDLAHQPSPLWFQHAEP